MQKQWETIGADFLMQGIIRKWAIEEERIVKSSYLT